MRPDSLERVCFQARIGLLAIVLSVAAAASDAAGFVTPSCNLPGGCIQFSPASPTSDQKIDVSITLYSGIPEDACIGALSTSVVGNVISISGEYAGNCPYLSLGLPTFVNTSVEPLAAGHYTLNFTASPDPSYGQLGWVYGPDGWVQAPVLVPASLDVAASASAVPNYGGLWWNAPAGSESGWGVNFAHQGSVIFATWFTYDLSGKDWWLSMTAPATGPGTFAGTLYQTAGPAFDTVPFDPSPVVATAVGTASLSFSDANNGTFAYTVNGISQTKAITREVFGSLPNCTFGVEPDLTLASNYQDLWWAAPAGSEAGWGVNLTQQEETIFATWFTYDLDHSPLWLSITAQQTAAGTYSGTIYRTTGPAFNSIPFLPVDVMATGVGTATFAFTDGNTGSFEYSVNGVTQIKAITREVFNAPGTVCQ
jgi:hypothetical protein